MPRHTRSKNVQQRNPNPGNRDWERNMMRKLQADNQNSSEDCELRPDIGYEFLSYGDFIDDIPE